ncbi:hypothetical protein Scep_003991 [Stephania cephalantha]|uniref:Uncharacterized protein n=1 Tax=Stephania cephalantha TaxID=152367 RepID=A0AAP0PUY0_9MAGN
MASRNGSSSAARGYAKAADERRGTCEAADARQQRWRRLGSGGRRDQQQQRLATTRRPREVARLWRRRRAAARRPARMAGRRCGSSSGACERRRRRGIDAGNGVEQRRGGALPGRSIPDETTMMDKASRLRRRDEFKWILKAMRSNARLRTNGGEARWRRPTTEIADDGHDDARRSSNRGWWLAGDVRRELPVQWRARKEAGAQGCSRGGDGRHGEWRRCGRWLVDADRGRAANGGSRAMRRNDSAKQCGGASLASDVVTAVARLFDACQRG